MFNDKRENEVTECEEDAINSMDQVEVVPETQMGPDTHNPTHDPSPSSSKLVGIQEPKLCQNQRVRNARGGDNPQTNRMNDIKAVARQTFKRSSPPINKVINISEEGSSKGKHEMDKKNRKSEVAMILERMRQMQLQKTDIVQACMGWFEPLHGVQVHVDRETVEFA